MMAFCCRSYSLNDGISTGALQETADLFVGLLDSLKVISAKHGVLNFGERGVANEGVVDGLPHTSRPYPNERTIPNKSSMTVEASFTSPIFLVFHFCTISLLKCVILAILFMAADLCTRDFYQVGIDNLEILTL
jgi:hypothetical protein